jgi:hypothetical protein
MSLRLRPQKSLFIVVMVDCDWERLARGLACTYTNTYGKKSRVECCTLVKFSTRRSPLQRHGMCHEGDARRAQIASSTLAYRITMRHMAFNMGQDQDAGGNPCFQRPQLTLRLVRSVPHAASDAQRTLSRRKQVAVAQPLGGSLRSTMLSSHKLGLGLAPHAAPP